VGKPNGKEREAMNVADVMTSDVVTVGLETPLRDVATLLTERRISGLPVVDEGHVVGVVSEGDILAKERGRTAERRRMFGVLLDDRATAELKLEARTAGTAMTSPAVTIAPDRPLAEAAGTMIDEGVNRLPVVSADGELLGIVTRADLVRAFVRTDEELAEDVREGVLLKALWITPGNVNVVVSEGVVTLTGEVENRPTAEMLPDLVRRVPGVVAVRSGVTWEDENGRR
jgi:CBS domain-containing protein